MSDASKLSGAENDADTLGDEPVAGNTVQECGECWIEIRLVDGHEPVADRDYEITLPDGEQRKGTLDKKGAARLEDIPCGTCLVRFPGTDLEDWQPVEGLPHERPGWIEIKLADEKGQPVAEERVEITDSAGDVHEATLDDKGVVRLAELAPGSCTVRFLDREGDDVAVAEGPRPTTS